MKLTKLNLLAGVFAALLTAPSHPQAIAADTIAGQVFIDANANSIRDEDERALPGALITDGIQFVTTDAKGQYSIEPLPDPVLSVGGGQQTLAISIPSGFKPVGPWFYRMQDIRRGVKPDFALASVPQPLPFVFVHGTDSHVPRGGITRFMDFKSDISKMPEAPAFTILTGDLCNQADSGTLGEATEQYKALTDQLKDFPTRCFCIPGNHDIAGVRATTGWDTNNENFAYGFYTRQVGPLRWSFDYADTHFVGIDYNRFENGKWSWGTPRSAVQWLDRDLELATNANRVFLFIHFPEATNQLAEVIQKHRVTQIFHGHDHQDKATVFAGVPALSSGSLAEVYEDKDRPVGYRVVHVGKASFEQVYRAVGEPFAAVLKAPRFMAKTGSNIAGTFLDPQHGFYAGSFWDPEHKAKEVWLRYLDDNQKVAFERDALGARFKVQSLFLLDTNKLNRFQIVIKDGALTWCTTPFAGCASELRLFEFCDGFDSGTLSRLDAVTTWLPTRKLDIQTGFKEKWPGITLKVAGGSVDLSRYQVVSFVVSNTASHPVTVNARLDNPGADGSKNCINGSVTLAPGREGELKLHLNPTPWRLDESRQIIGMRGAPGRTEQFDPAHVTQLLVFVHEPKESNSFVMGPVSVAGRVTTLPAKSFFPFIDAFGQFVHADWPGKTKSESGFITQKVAEEKDLAGNPAPREWNGYGGWKQGPQVEGTGYFRTQKWDGKWWLATPDGRLFWSHGVDCVIAGESTPISDRENYFAALPASDSPLAAFYGTGRWAPVGYYKDHLPYKTFSFSMANLHRKYGASWNAAFIDTAHKRLRSWGLNTIGNWSDANVLRKSITPYTATLHNSGRVIDGSSGYWGKFPDVYDPSFRQSIATEMQRHKDHAARDPWCIGFFVDNELAWGDETSLALAALYSSSNQPVKLAFQADLKEQYTTVDKLNATWDSRFESWEAFLQSHEQPNLKKADADLKRFYSKIAATYFQVVREEVKRVAPNHLYLGCRFAWMNERAMKEAAQYCDVLSQNVYEYTVAGIKLPAGIDRPLIIGEFHFGALDRGMFHTGLREAKDQADRAAQYTGYVRGALKHPSIVGTHWFQYQNQPTTGRGDGENYQIGFVDICDRPNPELVRASRQIGADMYEIRSSK